MIVKILTEHHLVFLCLKRGSRGSSESMHVKMPNCWESHALAHYYGFLSSGMSGESKVSLYNNIKLGELHLINLR